VRDFIRIYGRAVRLLAPEKGLAVLLAAANVGLATLVFVEPTLFGRIIDVLAGSSGRPAEEVRGEALFWLLLWGGLGFAGVAANVLVALHADRLAHRRRMAAMGRFFTHVLNLPPAFHGGTHSGRLMRTMLAGVDHLTALWLDLFREHLTTLVALALLLPIGLWRNWRLGLLLVVLTLLFAALAWIVIRRTERSQREVGQYHADVAARAGDVLGNVVLVQTFQRLRAEAREFEGMGQRLLAAQIPVLTYWAVVSVLSKAASTITLMLVFALGTLLHVRGLTTVGEIVSYTAFATLLIGRLEQAMSFLNRLFVHKEALAQFFEVLDTRSAVHERPGAAVLPRVKGEVRFEGVSLTYDGERPAVQGLDVAVPPGTMVALVGATGAGKSTAVALLMRLRDPDAGRILVDGVDIRDVTLDSLRANLGAVFQESLLFNRTIADNLRVGRPGASDEEIVQAAKLAEAHEFIVARPQGYQTVVGERGAGLSGGERQRLAIARALLKDPPILILDEATSALDAVTEAKVQRALRELLRGRTSFVIAHRLSTVRDADLVLVFDKGRIVERGGYRELIARGGRFAELVAAQLEPAPPAGPGVALAVGA
jgi:ATP-binding cassette, subfamily B, beta-glucan exporter